MRLLLGELGRIQEQSRVEDQLRIDQLIGMGRTITLEELLRMSGVKIWAIDLGFGKELWATQVKTIEEINIDRDLNALKQGHLILTATGHPASPRQLNEHGLSCTELIHRRKL